MMHGRPVVDGALRDLLEFGSAFGSAVLRPEDMVAPRRHSVGEALGMPLDALHVMMRQHVPTPLQVDDAKARVRIYGTLPKNLTPKSLSVSFTGDDDRNVLVKYFLGQDGESKRVVGMDEHFMLDFSPVDAPAVKYKASTGAFELVLTRPAVKAHRQVAIDFDTAPAAAKETSHLRKSSKPENLAMAKPTQAKTINVVVKAAAEAEKATGEVSLERRSASSPSRAQPSPREFIHESHSRRLPVSVVNAVNAEKTTHELAKMTKTLHEVRWRKPQKHVVRWRKQKASHVSAAREARAMEVADRVKKFVTAAHLVDAKKDLIGAFAPLDTDMGLIMLETNHRIRAH